MYIYIYVYIFKGTVLPYWGKNAGKMITHARELMAVHRALLITWVNYHCNTLGSVNKAARPQHIKKPSL